MKKIKFSTNKHNNQQFFTVSELDYLKVRAFSWCVMFNGFDLYVVRKATDKEVKEGWPRNIQLHRLILGLKKGDKRIADHKNRNRWFDHTRSNLRIASASENARNQRKARHNTSGFKGVSLYKKVHGRYPKDKWRAYITVNGTFKSLGYFDSKRKAQAAYKTAAKKYFGEFSNFRNRRMTNELPK